MISFKSRFIFFCTTVAAILVADLTITLLNKYLMTLRSRFDLHLVTLIGIVIVLVLFYIMIRNITRLSEWAVHTFVKLGRAYLGRSIGLYTTIAVAFVLIYAGYYWAWFDQNLFAEIVSKIKSLFIF